MFYAVRHQVYWDVTHVFFLLIIWFDVTQPRTKHTGANGLTDPYNYMLTPTVMCSQELCIALNESFADIKKLLYRVCNFFAFQKLLACKGRKHWKGLAITKISDTLFFKTTLYFTNLFLFAGKIWRPLNLYPSLSSPSHHSFLKGLIPSFLSMLPPCPQESWLFDD